MAFTSLTALPRACGQGVVAGLEKLYMIAHKDLVAASGSTNGNTYTTSSNGIVNAIGLASNKNFVEVGLLKSTAGLTEALTKDATKGISYFTQTFTLVLGDLSIENKAWIENIVNQPVAVLIKTRTGKYFVSGLNGQLELSALEGGTGTAEADLIGYTLTFTGIDTKLIPQVETSIVAALIATASVTTTFNTTLDFTSDTTDSDVGVTGTVAATDADLKFKFNSITTRTGTPASMSIEVGGDEVITVDYTTDYNGQAFQLIDALGVTHNGTFTNGTVTF